MNKQPTFLWHADAGHGWLAVKRDLLKTVGVYDQITPYSYQRGKTVYLEEDCDAGRFLNAYRATLGIEPRTKESTARPDRSPIRSYAHFKP